MKRINVCLIAVFIAFVGCQKNEEYKAQLNDPELFHSAVKIRKKGHRYVKGHNRFRGC